MTPGNRDRIAYLFIIEIGINVPVNIVGRNPLDSPLGPHLSSIARFRIFSRSRQHREIEIEEFRSRTSRLEPHSFPEEASETASCSLRWPSVAELVALRGLWSQRNPPHI